MSWTYTGDPASSELDKYRFLIGDTIQTQPIYQDEEINFVLGSTTIVNERLYQLFDGAATRFARDIRKSLGPQSEDPTKRQEFFESKAAYYRKLRASSSGLSQPKSTPTIFTKGMQDNV